MRPPIDPLEFGLVTSETDILIITVAALELETEQDHDWAILVDTGPGVSRNFIAVS